MSIFVDTGAFYALADSGDKHHQRVIALDLERAWEIFNNYEV